VHALIHPITFVKAVYRTFFLEGISVQAAGLGFKTLLSLIPLGVVVATIFAVVELQPMEERGRKPPAATTSGEAKTETAGGDGENVAQASGDSLGQIRQFLDSLFVPEKAREATEWIENQVRALRGSSTSVTIIGLILLAATGFFLFQTVETVMNQIFHVRTPRRFSAQLLAFWAFLTLGPLLLGVSMYGTHVFSAKFSAEYLPSNLSFLADYKTMAIAAIPFLFTLIAFFLLNWLSPNTHVRVVPALVGALIAALLWEGMKRGFNYFMQNYVSYQPLYGGLATGVILLIWLYLSWYVALLGATIAYHLQFPPGVGRWPGTESGPRLALGLVTLVADAFQRGDPPPTEKWLARRLNAPPGQLSGVCAPLEAAGILVRVEGRKPSWVLTRAAEGISLRSVYEALGDRIGGKPTGLSGGSADAFFRSIDEGVIASLGTRTVADLIPATLRPVVSRADREPEPTVRVDPAESEEKRAAAPVEPEDAEDGPPFLDALIVDPASDEVEREDRPGTESLRPGSKPLEKADDQE